MSKCKSRAFSTQLKFFQNPNRTFSHISSKSLRNDDVLLRLKGVVLTRPSSLLGEGQGPLELTISSPKSGGHLLLGPNGSGKSHLTSALGSICDENTPNNFFSRDIGNIEVSEKLHQHSIATVTFASHQAVLAEKGHWTAQKVITDGGNLNKAAQFLVVRLGLFPLLHRQMKVLSTGEIRKVLLVHALAQNPRLLVLDQAFDGLDVDSRQKHLLPILSQTLQGFRQDILVQGISAKSTERTQVLFVTQRADEIVDEMKTVSYLSPDGSVKTEQRGHRTASDCLRLGLGLNSNHAVDINWDQSINESVQLPTAESIQEWWSQSRPELTPVNLQKPLLGIRDFSLRTERSSILDSLDWMVYPKQNWWVSGDNGAGKSTLSGTIARLYFGQLHSQCTPNSPGSTNNEVLPEGTVEFSFQPEHKAVYGGVAWVSTESHMNQAGSASTVSQILHRNASPRSVNFVTKWLQLDSECFQQPFNTLSTGTQKKVLIASSLAQRPHLLIFDEVSQALDAPTRCLVLKLVNEIAKYTTVSIIFVTHHEQEVFPSVGHILHLQDRQGLQSIRLPS